MKLFKLALILGVLGLWLGASNHCLLENISPFTFLVCAPHGESTPHQDKDCDDDMCARVEKAAYKAEQKQASAPARVLVQVPDLIAALLEGLDDDLANAVPSQSEFFELPASAWRFAFSTVAPPRAPSFVS